MIGLLIGLAIGALGGNLAGYFMKDKSLGTLWNSVVGILGGGIGFYILDLAGLAGSGMIASLIAALIGGSVLLFVVALVRKRGA
ncbi:MAG TPA: hypothetical protein PKM48_12595 [Parvularculaceae bacterium]|nr:hypothetical protein [Parvularculaceae bacterium]HNS87599.1 hypothetical protein [Parvularculaceae bacterium]